MSATIINQTNFPDRRVQKIVRWTLSELDADLTALVVKVKPTKSHVHSGRFWPNARTAWTRVWSRETGERIIKPSLPFGTQHLVVARVPEFPFGHANRIRRGGPPKFSPQSWEESLVCIVAHEAMHFRQFLFPREGQPRWSEVQAEWAEYRLLERWRKKKKR